MLISLDCYSFHFFYFVFFFPLVHLSILPNFCLTLVRFLCSHTIYILWFANKTPTLYSRKAYCSPPRCSAPACLSPRETSPLPRTCHLLSLPQGSLTLALGSRSAQREKLNRVSAYWSPFPPPAVRPCEKLTISREEAGRSGRRKTGVEHSKRSETFNLLQKMSIRLEVSRRR